jgi:hypothetical protein
MATAAANSSSSMVRVAIGCWVSLAVAGCQRVRLAGECGHADYSAVVQLCDELEARHRPVQLRQCDAQKLPSPECYKLRLDDRARARQGHGSWRSAMLGCGYDTALAEQDRDRRGRRRRRGRRLRSEPRRDRLRADRCPSAAGLLRGLVAALLGVEQLEVTAVDQTPAWTMSSTRSSSRGTARR